MIEKWIDSVDIAEYIGQYVELEERGGELWGFSPFQEEKTPSFSVDPEQQLFYDFSTGIGGNVFNFIREYHQCSFTKAVNILQNYCGNTSIQVTPHLNSFYELKKFTKKAKPSKKNTTTVLPQNYMDRYEDNPEQLHIWEEEGIDNAVLKKYLIRYDPFSNRLVYPIRSPTGEIINVSGRTLEEDYQAKRIRKYTYFKPFGQLNTIGGLFENRDSILAKKEIILFEGIKSVMIAESWNIINVGAVLTSHLNPQQLKLLIQLGVRCVFALDENITPEKDKNIKKLKRFIPVEIVNGKGILEEKMSPVDMGIEIWKEIYERRKVL